MCAPLVVAGIMVAASAAQSASQASQTNRLNRMRGQQAAQNQNYLIEQENYAAQARAIKSLQTQQRLYNETLDISRQAAMATSMSRLDAAESGAKGKSIENLYRDFARQKAEQMEGIDNNLQAVRFGADLENRASGINSRLAGASPTPVGGPTALSSIASALSAGVSGFALGSSMTGGSQPSSGSISGTSGYSGPAQGGIFEGFN